MHFRVCRVADIALFMKTRDTIRGEIIDEGPALVIFRTLKRRERIQFETPDNWTDSGRLDEKREIDATDRQGGHELLDTEIEAPTRKRQTVRNQHDHRDCQGAPQTPPGEQVLPGHRYALLALLPIQPCDNRIHRQGSRRNYHRDGHQYR